MIWRETGGSGLDWMEKWGLWLNTVDKLLLLHFLVVQKNLLCHCVENPKF